ncbi:MAG: hypothetical protein R3293_02775 [Candidatus Promineifilaceae bacterium]|nr:hypothetical protein [Candidatus Promineifilaceae bacterium]
MKIGMLWLDTDSKRSLDEKVRRAVDYYADKYGQRPELCLVNKKTLGEEKKVDRVMVQPAKNVLPGHFWLGMAS